MLTIENLKEAGADVKSGIERCAGNEAFYLKIAGMVINQNTYDDLKAAIEAHDLDKAFEAAHSLKGVVSNASLDRLLAPIQEMTEHLRTREDIDYTPYLDDMFEQLAILRAL